MCIIIFNSKNKIPENVLYNCYLNNPDGMGLAYIKDNKVMVYKTMDFKRFLKKYLSIKNFPVCLHFRVGTSGRVGVQSAHPFYVNKNTVLFHNGIIQGLGNRLKSDTQEFANILQVIKDLYSNKAIKLISLIIGHSKIILFSPHKYKIINENLGHWDGGNWYSNYSYLNYKKSKYINKNCINCGKIYYVLDSVFKYDNGLCKLCDDNLTDEEKKYLNWINGENNYNLNNLF